MLWLLLLRDSVYDHEVVNGIAKKIAHNTLYLFTAQGVVHFTNFICVVLIARHFKPENFGQLNFAFSVMMFFLILSIFGLEVVGVRETARDEVNKYRIFINTWLLRLAFALISFGLLAAASFLITDSERRSLVLIYGATVLSTAFFIDWFFQGMEQMGHVAIARIGNAFAYLLLVLFIVTQGWDLMMIPAAWSGSIILGGMYLFFVLGRQFHRADLRIDLRLARGILRKAYPIGLVQLMILMFYDFSVIILGIYRENVEVGYYSASFKIIFFFIPFFDQLLQAMFPRLSHAFVRDKRLFQELLTKTLKLVIIASLPVAAIGSVLAQKAVVTIYGHEYVQAGYCLGILIWMIPVAGINTIYMRALLASDAEKRNLVAMIIQKVTTALGILIFAPKFGFIAAAIVTVCSECIGTCAFIFALKPITHLGLGRRFFKPAIAAAGALLVTSQMSDWYLLAALAGGLSIYFSIIFLLREITIQDLRDFQRVISRDTYR